MTDTKAIELLNSQFDKISILDENNYKSMQIYISSWVKDVFGEESEEFKYIISIKIGIGYTDIPYQNQINSFKPYLS